MKWRVSRVTTAKRKVKPPGRGVALLICVACGSAWAQTPEMVCNRGTGHFEGSFPTGVTVRVGAVASGGFATRACEAVLSRGSDRLVVVPTAAQVDIDVLGADLGFDVPVVAFTVRRAQDDWRVSYEIWSIGSKPRLLRTLTGGDSYRAIDADFNRQVAIWTTDAAVVEGFEGLSYADYTVPPMVVLRFEHGSLVNVSAWYRAQYDRQIAALQGSLTAAALSEFRMSDGQLRFGAVPAAEWVRLRKTKAVVLEIVWAYLYSGRPERAWAELEVAWPARDVARIKAAIMAAYPQGIEAQAAKVSSATRSPKWMERPRVYEYLKPVAAQGQTSGRLTYGAPGVTGVGAVLVKDRVSSLDMYGADTEPQPISLWRPPPSAAEQALALGMETVSLTIDEAGKVESAKMLVPESDPNLLAAARHWKFIPASSDGKPVAYKLEMNVQPLR